MEAVRWRLAELSPRDLTDVVWVPRAVGNAAGCVGWVIWPKGLHQHGDFVVLTRNSVQTPS